MSGSRQTKRLADYQPPFFTTESVELEFDLAPEATRVTAISQLRRQMDGNQPLVLDGQSLQIVGVWVNGVACDDYQQTAETLTLTNLPAQFTLKIVTLINPSANTALEGLYLSAGAYCTQCEAEGFRRITYYQDRPDVLARFTTHLIGDATTLPQLLSNGNKVADVLLPDGRRRVSWSDPFPKPCYLFALVAGDFDQLNDVYTTASGREVQLQFFVDKGNQARAQFAMGALKRAMRWDEQEFGLEYDLDIYMVVAVDFFNMGAMENKGLNVFNSKFVLANPQTATDTDYFNIESIIGHEYFHNWTGNRVTCRDWFQLSLKEGLTVFRDQQFSAAMGSPTLCRIDAVKTIRTAQFAEDAGPMAHPIRPEQVVEMNNFYTVTVYDKGAEVIRMQHSLLGQAGFRRGMDLYFQRFDGMAVTCDDFVEAMQDASGVDLSQFKRWYQQAGTPELAVQSVYDAEKAQLHLTVTQHTPATADGSLKLPLVMPLRCELLARDLSFCRQEMLVLTQQQQTFTLEQVATPVLPVLLADFSAPVKLNYPRPLADLLLIAAHAIDGVARWDAMQQIWADLVSEAVTTAVIPTLPPTLISTFRALLTQPMDDLAFTAELLSLPGFDTLAEQYSQIPLDDILRCLDGFKAQIAKALQAEFLACYQQLPRLPYQYSQAQVGSRQLQILCLHYLALQGGSAVVEQHYRQADNMTDRQGAIQAAVKAALPLADVLLTDFLQRDGHDPLLFDKWANLQVSVPDASVFDRMVAVRAQSQFSLTNPNRVRAVYSAFSMLNPKMFHQPDGKGYQQLLDIVSQVDHTNPQLAARLITPLLSWRRFDESRQQLIRTQLERILQQQDLSNDLFEKVSRSLA